MSYENPWIFCDLPFEEKHVGAFIGFVYRITDTTTGKKYIGKKIFNNKVSKKPLKGKTRRRISSKSSDWMTYYGSNETLKNLVEANDKLLYKREILKLCKSKSEMSYFESKLLFQLDAILSPVYFNDWVSCKITRKQVGSLQFDRTQ